MKKGLTPLRKQKLSKKAQEKDDKIKRKLHPANGNCNYWKFQLHWNKLDWVDSRSKIKIKKPIRFLQRNTTLTNMIEWIVGLDINY